MNILMLSHFPYDKPRHGGQQRLFHIREKYRSLGYNVLSAGILGSELYEKTPHFIPYPHDKILTFSEKNFLLEDYIIGELLYSDFDLFNNLKSQITFIPDIIHVEQPWLFKFAERFVKQFDRNIPIIYGSQNIESQARYQLLTHYYSRDFSDHYASLIAATETYAASHADFVLAVTDSDAKWYKSRIQKDVLLAPNGVSSRNYSLADFKNQGTNFNRYCLFVASSYPPNVDGFFKIFEPGLGFLSPEEKIIIVGSVSDSIKGDLCFHKIPMLFNRAEFISSVSEEQLGWLIANAHCIIVPILEGGGSNLKTAEALYSNHYVVATPKAMIGYESFADEPGVFVCDSSIQFRKKIRDVMNLSPLTLDEKEINHRKLLQWDFTLKACETILNSVQGK